MNYENYVVKIFELFIKSVRVLSSHMGSCSKGANGILFYLHVIHNGATPTEMREFFKVGSGGMANALKDMEDKGLIIRKNNENDKRIVEVYISEKGHELAHEIYLESKERMKQLLEAIGEEDTKAMIRVLNKAITLSENDVFKKGEFKC